MAGFISLGKLKQNLKRVVGSAHDHWLRLNNKKLADAFSIISHLTVSERVKLFELATGRLNIAEIGSYVGASACCFGAAGRDLNSGKIICIDTWNNNAMSEGNRDTWAEFQRNTQAYKSHIIPIRGFSTAVVQEVRRQAPKLDLLFIDGDHSYEGVKADWEAYKSFLQSGSIVIFHDSGWAEGVKRVIQEDVIHLVEVQNMLPNMWWGTLFKSP
jgi:predicted O-methyltransferase YrrM